MMNNDIHNRVVRVKEISHSEALLMYNLIGEMEFSLLMLQKQLLFKGRWYIAKKFFSSIGFFADLSSTIGFLADYTRVVGYSPDYYRPMSNNADYSSKGSKSVVHTSTTSYAIPRCSNLYTSIAVGYCIGAERISLCQWL